MKQSYQPGRVEETCNGFTISVETFYQADYSNPLQHEFMFAYRVKITNLNNFPIQVLKRKWHIFDSDTSDRIVEGDGIVGMQPQINAGEQYEYVSGCNLHSEVGYMVGEYTCMNLRTRAMLQAYVPKFWMVVPFKLN